MITVIGKLRDTYWYRNEPTKYNVMSMDNWTPEKNRSWMDEAIARHDDFLIISTGEVAGEFANELQYLMTALLPKYADELAQLRAFYALHTSGEAEAGEVTVADNDGMVSVCCERDTCWECGGHGVMRDGVAINCPTCNTVASPKPAVCRWTAIGARSWKSECAQFRSALLVVGSKYCPFCGKPIEVNE